MAASALVSKKYRHLLEDVARADRLVWDARTLKEERVPNFS